MSSTVRLGRGHPKSPVFVNSGAKLRLNLSIYIGIVDLEDHCDLWLIRIHSNLRKPNKQKSNRVKSHAK